MGLDQYIYAVPKQSVDLSDNNLIIMNSKFTEEDFKVQFHYWRKHYPLHNWMEKLYLSRGGTEEFNCVPVPLFKEVLEQLKQDIESNVLPYTEGIYYPSDNLVNSTDPRDQEIYYSQKSQDLDFVEKAFEHLSKNRIVYYDSWW
jgi:hypothetical protein